MGTDMTEQATRLVIRGARIIDPANSIDAVGDILIENGRIAAVGQVDEGSARGAEAVDAAGLTAVPGFVDIHTHLREPGLAGSETVLSGSRAAINGGYTTICAMPNTEPPVDSPQDIAYQKVLGARADYARVYPICAVTTDRAGEALVEMAACAAEGAVAFSDDGACLPTARMVSKALTYAKLTGLPVIEHAEDASLSGKGVVHRGAYSTSLGLAGIPPSSEEVIVARDCIIARETGGRIHIAHVSTSGAVDLLAWAKRGGVAVTAEVTPHNLVLDDSTLESFHTSFKMKPPLRSRDHIDALRRGLIDGTIDCVATDHAPHRMEDKEVEFEYASFGVCGLETAFGVLHTQLVAGGLMGLSRLVEVMTVKPAQVLNLSAGTLSVGAPADITLVDTNEDCLVDTDKFLSAGKNSAFEGWRIRGCVKSVLVGGVWKKRDGAVL